MFFRHHSDNTGDCLDSDLVILDSGNGILASFAKEGVTPPDITPDANIDPDELDFGFEYLYDDHESKNQDQTVGQYWYPFGSKNFGVSIWFHSMGFLTYCEDGEETTIDYIVKDNHIIDEETNGKFIDFIFTDEFTAFDCIGGFSWARANEIEMAYYLSATPWETSDGNIVYTFYQDGTFEQNFLDSGDTYSGIWYMEDGNHIITADEDGSDRVRASVFYDRTADDFKVRALCESEKFYYTPVE